MSKLAKDRSGYWVKQNVIKPCPFCGGKAIIDTFEEAQPYESSFYYAGETLRCKCGVEIKEYCEDEYNLENRTKARKKLLKIWNKRCHV